MMIKVEPKVFCIAHTQLDKNGVNAWLEHVGGMNYSTAKDG